MWQRQSGTNVSSILVCFSQPYVEIAISDEFGQQYGNLSQSNICADAMGLYITDGRNFLRRGRLIILAMGANYAATAAPFVTITP